MNREKRPVVKCRELFRLPATFSHISLFVVRKQWLLFAIAAIACGVGSFFLVRFNFGITITLKYIFGAWCLFVAALIDFRLKIIPNRLVVILLVVGTAFLIPQYFEYNAVFKSLLIGSVVGLVLCFLLFYVMSVMTKGGVGMGDVKLFTALGWFFGVKGAVYTMILSLLLCVLFSVVLLVMRIKKAKDHIPFGPFIFAGYCASLILGLF